jgi:hypothetical protein
LETGAIRDAEAEVGIDLTCPLVAGVLSEDLMNTHDVILDFGMHRGDRLTRVPVSYLKWMLNTEGLKSNWRELAIAEFERRGDTMPLVELTGHAIDNASLRCRKRWHETRGEDEGLYSWLQRVTLEALEKGERLDSGKIRYLSMKFVIAEGPEFPVLKTIMT